MILGAPDGKFGQLKLAASGGARDKPIQPFDRNASTYLSKLPRFEKKVRVALDWSLDLFFSKDLVHFMILRSPTVSHAEHAHAEEQTSNANS
jgi:hypothetical protein